MEIDVSQPIAGFKVATVRSLVRCRLFDERDAANVLRRPRAEIGKVLDRLAGDGWIERDPRDPTLWRAGPKGLRLRSTKLMRRFPIELGRSIVADVVAEARRANAEPERSTRVAEIFLYGSVLHGKAGDFVGDVDLHVVWELRKLPEPELERLQEAELNSGTRPRLIWEIHSWGSILLLKRLRRISRRLSLSDWAPEDAVKRLVYAFDVKRERERPVESLPPL